MNSENTKLRNTWEAKSITLATCKDTKPWDCKDGSAVKSDIVSTEDICTFPEPSLGSLQPLVSLVVEFLFLMASHEGTHIYLHR